MEDLLAESGLDGAAVRLPALKDRPDKNTVKVDGTGRATGYSITTGDAANFMLDIIERRRHVGASVGISN